ncbi:hypothetical protein Aduo_009047 [Ancylostoma duodenale]
MISISSKAKSYDDSLHHPNKDHHPDFLDDQLNALAADGLSYATTLEENAKEVLQEGDNYVIAQINATFSDDDEVIAEDLGSDAMPDGIFVGKTLLSRNNA